MGHSRVVGGDCVLRHGVIGADEHEGGSTEARGAERGQSVDDPIEQPERTGRREQFVTGVSSADDGRLAWGANVRRWSIGPFTFPALAHDHTVEGEASRPAETLEARRGRTFIGPTDAEPAEGLDARGEVHQIGQVRGPKERDPTDAETLGASREPEVLDRTGARPEVGVVEGGAAQHARRFCAPIAGDDEPERRLAYTFQLEVEQPSRRFFAQVVSLAKTLAVRERCGSFAGRLVGDEDESPGLRMSHRRRRVCRE